MFTLIIRALVIYALLLIVSRLMGKRQLGQMQPFELVLTLILADLSTFPMTESSIPLLHGIVPLLVLVVAHYVLTLVTRKNDKINRIVSGKPVIVINPKGIDYVALQKLNLSLDDLFESIRGCGYFSLDQVQYAIVETNGTVNVLSKKDFSTVTLGDIDEIKIEKSKLATPNCETSIPVTLVSEGSILKDNLQIAKLDEKFVDWVMKKTKTKELKDILILTVDGNGKIYFQPKDGEYITFESQYSKEIV